LELRHRNVGVTDVGQRKDERSEGRPGLRGEPKLVDDVFSDAVLVVVDVDAVEHVVVEVEVVWAIAGLLARDHVDNEYDLVQVFPAPEGVDVGSVRRWVQGDQRRLPVAGGPGDSSTGGDHECHRQSGHGTQYLLLLTHLSLRSGYMPIDMTSRASERRR